MAQQRKSENIAARDAIKKIPTPTNMLANVYKQLNDVGASLTDMVNSSNLYEKAIEDLKLDLSYLGEISDISLKLNDVQTQFENAKRTYDSQLEIQAAQLESDKKRKQIELSDYCKEQTAILDSNKAEFDETVKNFNITKKDYEERSLLVQKYTDLETKFHNAQITVIDNKKDAENTAALEKMRTDGIISNLTDKITNLVNDIAKKDSYIATLENKVADTAKMIADTSSKAMEAFSTKGQSDNVMSLVRDMNVNGNSRSK